MLLSQRAEIYRATDTVTMPNQRFKRIFKNPPNPALLGDDGTHMIAPLIPYGRQQLRNVATGTEKDLVLEVQERSSDAKLYYLVSSVVLRKASSYFRVLLDPAKFNEGINFDHALRALLDKHGDLKSVPVEDLPRISITDFGQIPPKSKIQDAVTSLLCILHQPEVPGGYPSLHCRAMVAVMADRYDCVGAVAHHVAQDYWPRRAFDIDVFDSWGVKEEVSTRQLLLLGVLLKTEIPKFKLHAANLIVRSSQRWKIDPRNKLDTEALWWNLPGNMEGMLSPPGKGPLR